MVQTIPIKLFGTKKSQKKAFNLFWGNPNTNLTGDGGITSTFQWHDVQFFLLDDRYFRTPNDNELDERHMLGGKQIDWLINSLISSDASF